MRRFLTSSVPMWWLVLLTAFAMVVIGAVASSKDAKTQQAVATSTTFRATTSTGPTTTTEPVPTTPATVAQPVTVLDLSGSNDTTSDNFSVKGKWTLAVDCTGGAGMATEIIDASSQAKIDYVSFQTPCGTSAQRSSGVFFLKVSTFGAKWHVVVTDDPG